MSKYARTLLTIGEIEYECLGKYGSGSPPCIQGCCRASVCKLVTCYIPSLPVNELAEHLASKWLKVRTVATARLVELQNG